MVKDNIRKMNVCMYDYVTMLYSRNTVNQLYSNKNKNKINKQ